MSGELATAEDLEALNAGEDTEAEVSQPPIQLVPIPAKIVTGHGNLLCELGGSWGYTPYGIFASGQIEGEDTTDDGVDWLIPYNELVRVEFNYPAYFNHLKDQEKGQEDETPSD
jgi:hypothetical protein